tara:strand:+ start:706 stop:1131 length:426 start_codon:yes stop_codon:yes gene_type:complete
MEIVMNAGRYEARENGVVLARAATKSAAKYHGRKKLEVMPAAKVQEFGINKRFDFVDKLVSMVATKKAKSVIISGPGGLGKTYSVMEALTKSGLRDISAIDSLTLGSKIDLSKCFRFIKGYSTAKGLYRTLYESRNMTLSI